MPTFTSFQQKRIFILLKMLKKNLSIVNDNIYSLFLQLCSSDPVLSLGMIFPRCAFEIHYVIVTCFRSRHAAEMAGKLARVARHES